MHRVTLVLCVLALSAAAGAARAGDEGAPPAAMSRTALAALPPLAPVEREAVGATDASGGGTILMSALYGGLAGAVVGVGIGLLENGNYGRDIAIGAGAGILIGGALGAAHALGDSRGVAATDGLNTTERYPVLTARTVRLGGRF
ncbi:hypothetical protein [Anaeromyxobacter diazotrophicus]|uniref:Glycine zipper domain-containing protein n=1 Tax=Anaeromyxobacter diazotrophicus TaxID=2590199 RepID=A0A7I9VJA6_9BACT|nr:hypothetical protein [Anaeromyxobacter diazotrophicus]GEJ56238.1 hypothetical protein AMYX_09790 [Anaeromyxobacter diazotrophicus]